MRKKRIATVGNLFIIALDKKEKILHPQKLGQG